MRAFDWRDLLSRQGVAFIERGPNVKRGELNIRCPFCGSADPSYHMGLNLETGWWSCWRNKEAHSGKSPLRLLVRLLGISYYKARELAGLSDDYIDPEGFDAVAARLMGRGEDAKRPEQIRRRVLKPDQHFKRISDRAGTRRWWNYLYERRGFSHPDDVDRLCDQYRLYAARDGTWSGRLILPYFMDGELVSWTGRSITDASVKYLDLTLEESLVAPKHTLFNHDCIRKGGRVLVVQEGPMDALKIDFYGQDFGVRSVALSTNSITSDQMLLIEEAADSFDRVIIMLDTATPLGVVDSMRMKQELRAINQQLEIAAVPYGLKDGAMLSPRQATEWARQTSKGLS